MTEPYHPPGAFYFSVRILGAGMAASLVTDNDASFQEVSGMEVRWDVEEVAEGGENRFVHRLPRPAKYSNLVLKRGVVTGLSFFTQWVDATLGANLDRPIGTQNLLVMLLDEQGIPSIVWVFVNAYPVKCETGGLSSMDNKILIETLELSYNYFERMTLGSMAAAAAQLAKLAQRFA